MKTEGNPRDDRWMGALAVTLVGCTVTLCMALAPPSGWNVAGHEFKWSMPPEWTFAGGADDDRIIVPRKQPSDIEELLARYDSGWQAATRNAPDAVVPEPRTDSTAVQTATMNERMAGAEDAVDAPLETSAPAVPTSDTIPVRRSAPWSVPDAGALPASIQLDIPEASRATFGRLFSRLVEHGNIEVLHYGDSQIEGDRISGVMRKAWQERWGGYGPGMQAPVPLVPSFAVRQSFTGAWSRHTRYGRRDTTDLDERYGLMACYATLDTAGTDAGLAAALPCLSSEPEPRNHAPFGRWNALRIWHDTVATSCPIALNGVPCDTLRAGTSSGTLTLRLTASPESRAALPTEVCFAGTPPRIHALEPVGVGIQWHNVPMRGSSGTLFRKLERAQFSQQLATLAPDLIILQFGGNYVPHCPPDGGADRYGGWFSSQIRLFKRLLPQSAILVIGPSDMAVKTGLEWTPFAMLDEVRQALRKAAHEEGVAYWDLLDVMGGLGSMPAWVASQPPLAGPDHIHFTPLGARKVGTLLDRAFLAAYGDWQRDWSAPAPQALGSRRAATLEATHPTRPAPSLHVRQ